MRQEIDAGRPVLFVWDYPSNGTSGNSPVGLHELVVIGYSDDSGTQQLQIWDPWPVPESPPSEVPACGPANGVQVNQGHSQTIDFSTYSDPVSDMGVSAVHAQDQWDLAAVSPVPDAPVLTIDRAAPPPLPSPPPFQKLPQPPQRALRQVSFAEALHAALAAESAARSAGTRRRATLPRYSFSDRGPWLPATPARSRQSHRESWPAVPRQSCFPLSRRVRSSTPFCCCSWIKAGSAKATPTLRSPDGSSMCGHATPRRSACRSRASTWFQCRAKSPSSRPTAKARRRSSSRLRRIPRLMRSPARAVPAKEQLLKLINAIQSDLRRQPAGSQP